MNNNLYSIGQYNFSITSSNLDYNGYLKLESIFDFLQEAAIRHSEENEVGYDDLIKENIIWILIRQKVSIIKNIKNIKEIKVVTWPRINKKIEYYREFKIYSLNNELLVKASSTWSLFNIKTKFLEFKKIINFKNELLDEISLEQLKKLTFNFDNSFKLIDNYKVYKSYYDRNNHMNNSRYIEIISNSTKINNIKEIQIDFIKQCYLNNFISLYEKINNNTEEIIGMFNGSVAFKALLLGE